MSAKVYVGNLSWNTNDESLRSHFSNYGNILDSMVMRDRDTGRSRGFGFVTYSNSSEAESAVGAMNDQEIDGKHVKEVKAVMVEDTAVVILKEVMVEAIKATDM
ncbi:RNA recognition motif domain [Fusarium oxysporum f. sp. vasinfectum]|nr:RNA recognition motif domain [Fusarium oxysporum f. sp. vasinfectum]